MTLSPGYGETPLDGDEFDALVPSIRDVLGADVTKAAVFDLEQAVQDEVAADLLNSVLARDIAIDELLTDSFVRELHRRLYTDIWMWGGKLRVRELTLGVAPEVVAVELRTSLDTFARRPRLRSCATGGRAGALRLVTRQVPLHHSAARVRRAQERDRPGGVRWSAATVCVVGVTPPPVHPPQQTSPP